jgi:hypothetical protein
MSASLLRDSPRFPTIMILKKRTDASVLRHIAFFLKGTAVFLRPMIFRPRHTEIV